VATVKLKSASKSNSGPEASARDGVATLDQILCKQRLRSLLSQVRA
jgi:hypothetical protein